MKKHLRASMDMGKTVSNRTFCGMTKRMSLRGNLFFVTEDPKKVTCKKCLAKMTNKPYRVTINESGKTA